MQTATNPNTGEKVAFIDGEWKPISQTATNEKGQKAYLVGSQWVVADGATPTEKPTPKQKQEPEATTAEKIAGDPLMRLAGGAAEPFMGMFQGLANGKLQVQNPIIAAAQMAVKGMGGDKTINANIKQMDEMKKAGMKAAGQEGFDWMGLVGNMFSPATWGSLATNSTGKLAKISQGVIAGSSAGASQTVKEGDFDDEKRSQVYIGALLGGLLPAGKEAVTGAKQFIRGLTVARTEQGKLRLIGEYMNRLAGEEKDTVIKALKEANEVVAGSKPTAGEALSELPQATAILAKQAQIEKSAAKASEETMPTSAKFAMRRAEQEAARAKALGNVAQTPEALTKALEGRTADAARNYGEAYAQRIKADPRLAKLSRDPYFKDAVPDAIKLAESKGVDPKEDLTQFLHFVKLSLDKQLTKSGDTALSNTERDAVQKVQKELVDWMGTKNTAYNKARDEFSKASVPINQMQVGQFLEKKLFNALEDEKAGAFATAVREAPNTIKKSSGQARFTDLGQVLSKEQKSTIDSILVDLKKSNDYRQLARKTDFGMHGGKVAEESSVLPPMLEKAATIANWTLKKLRHGTIEEIDALMGNLMLDPKKLAQVMESIPSEKRGAVAEAFIKRVSPENRAALAKALMATAPVAGATDE